MMEVEQFRRELADELEQLLSYWIKNAVDNKFGGFTGKIDEHNQVQELAPKGSVLNSRILWTFAAAYNRTHQPAYLEMADRAYEYLCRCFIDNTYGGVYWTVDYLGHPLETKKQVYASAFALYALAEYYSCRQEVAVKMKCRELFSSIEKYSYDPVNTGYIDAFARNWTSLEDLRLSEKDANEKKTMNTHLHILEAYTQLYRIDPNENLRISLRQLIHNFLDHFINKETAHLHLFFDESWNLKEGPVSFGHDIEAAWLLFEAATALADESLVAITANHSLLIAKAGIEGLDADGGLWYEWDSHNRQLVKEKHWWPQAEAMVGFFNAYQLSGDSSFLKLSMDSWSFIKRYLKDPVYGEWYWGVDDHYTPMKNQDKAGLWKCPYHNGRACLEIMRRVGEVRGK